VARFFEDGMETLSVIIVAVLMLSYAFNPAHTLAWPPIIGSKTPRR